VWTHYTTKNICVQQKINEGTLLNEMKITIRGEDWVLTNEEEINFFAIFLLQGIV
jgi:hypothetical protein